MTDKVNPIPENYHSITPYLVVKNADKAIEFYKKAFNATERMRMGAPGGKIGHAEIEIGNSCIMLADEFPEQKVLGPISIGGSPVSLMFYVENVDQVFEQAISAGGKVINQIEDKFYGDRMGSLEDPYGHIWHLATHIKEVPVEEMQAMMESESK